MPALAIVDNGHSIMMEDQVTTLGFLQSPQSMQSVKAALRAPRSRSQSLDTGLCASAYYSAIRGMSDSYFHEPGSAPSRTAVMATVRLHIETVQKTAVGGDLALEKDGFKQAFSYEHENHYL
jgi:hypothetical protein